MTYHYREYWASITPVRDPGTHRAVYWKYEIYRQGDNTLLLDGRDVDVRAARLIAEANVDRLVVRSRRLAA